CPRRVQPRAERRGHSVAATDVDDKRRQPVAGANRATTPAPTVEPTAAAEATATPESAVAITAPTPQATLTPFPFLATSPTAVPTLEQSAYADALQKLLDRTNSTEADFRKQLQDSLLRDKLQTAIGTEQFPDTQEQVHVR